MSSRNDNELPWIWRAFMVVAIPALILVFLNWWSGGEVAKLVDLARTGNSHDATSEHHLPAHVVDDQPTDSQIEDAMRGEWSCYFDPTMNNDWHDDVVCHNGVESLRPVLLQGSTFVTKDDMIAAGQAYEAELNR